MSKAGSRIDARFCCAILAERAGCSYPVACAGLNRRGLLSSTRRPSCAGGDAVEAGGV